MLIAEFRNYIENLIDLETIYVECNGDLIAELDTSNLKNCISNLNWIQDNIISNKYNKYTYLCNKEITIFTDSIIILKHKMPPHLIISDITI